MFTTRVGLDIKEISTYSKHRYSISEAAARRSGLHVSLVIWRSCVRAPSKDPVVSWTRPFTLGA